MVFALRPSHIVRQQFSSVRTILFVLCLQSFFVLDIPNENKNLHTRSRRDTLQLGMVFSNAPCHKRVRSPRLSACSLVRPTIYAFG